MCKLCERVEILSKQNDPAKIKEFKHSYLILGDHQYYDGYSVLVLKKHVADLIDLPENEQSEFFGEVMQAASAIKKAFNPYKINYAVLGNEVEHVHFHLIPRYQEELSKAEDKNPWFYSKEFANHKVSLTEQKNRSLKIKKHLGIVS